jgi:hypothetical protein
MIWAIEHWDGKRWKAAAGYLHTSRAQAIRNMQWAQKQFPSMRFRVWPYVARNAPGKAA